jgi:cell division protein FtsI (penicillin-binding protein 3)
MSWRHYVLALGFCALVMVLAARVAYLGIEERMFLKKQGDARAVRTEVLRAQRGVVRDRWGEPLAISTPVYTAWSDPSLAQVTEAQVAQLAAVLGVAEVELAAKLGDRSRQFVYLRRRMDWQLAQAVEALEIDGVYLSTEYRRFYPAGETTAHVVGITGLGEDGVDERGLEGIERAYNKQLRSVSGRKKVLRDRSGQNIDDLEFVAAPKYGEDLQLSLDLRLQFIAYRELKSAVQGHGAKSASLVMLDARTGEILALVNQPSYNPNEPLQPDYEGVRNRAVTDVYEPGSTIKPFAVLAALESGRFETDSRIDTAPGYMWVGNKLVQDPLNRGVMSLTHALEKSSQVAIAKLALALEEREVYDVLARAGIGTPVGSGLPGEAAGRFSDVGLDNEVVRVTLAYGYGLSLSPLQLAQAYLTLASGGELLTPSILLGAARPGERAFSPALTRSVLEMMETVTSEQGTAPKARIAGYRVAGKTGTARIVGKQGYDDERHVALFAGVVPIEDPRLVMVVVVNEPSGGVSGGGAVAAPVFARVAERSLRLLGVPSAPNVQLAGGGG